MTNDLIAFLRARLDEDERVARDVAGGADLGAWQREDHNVFKSDLGRKVLVVGGGEGSPDADELDHIARHDPARVLRDVEAKRRLVAEIFEYEATEDGELGCCHSADDIAAGQCPGTDLDKLLALRLLALPYAEHPSYREQWRP